MIIGVHAVAAYREKPTGVEGYARTLIDRVIGLPDASEHRFLLYADPSDDQKKNFQAENTELRALKSPALWTQARLSLEILTRPPDVLFVPAQALPRILPKRTVVTIHGVEFLQASHHYAPAHRRYLMWVTKDALRRADAVIAVSQATKSALIDRFQADPDRITVIRHGSPTAPKRVAKRSHKRPYFLFIGRLETHKNVDGIVRAFSQLRRKGRDIDLLLVGSRGFGYEAIVREISESAFKDDIYELGYVDEGVKEELLQHALAFVFPSLAEGFGLPVLEAQSAAVPVITSSTTALPEITGDSGLLVDPRDGEALLRAMGRVHDDFALRKRLVAAGKTNIRRFSWDRAAQQTLNLLLGE